MVTVNEIKFLIDVQINLSEMTNKIDKPLNVAWLGVSGFPFGLAEIQKTIILGDALVKVGVQFTVINRKGVFERDQHTAINAAGEFKGINYVYASGITYRPKNFFIRNFMKIKGTWNEYWFLRKMHSEDKSLIAIVSNLNFLQSFLYLIYGKILNFPVIYLYVEMPFKMQHRAGALTKVNDYLFDKLLLKRMSGALPISELLIENFQKIAPGKPILKIPTICDFESFNVSKKNTTESYFLFCGAFDYREIINFILDAFKLLDDSLNTKLYLIISKGSPKQYEEFNQYLKDNNLTQKTKIFSNIPFSELVDLYVNASALLIPLRPTNQDAARFPHKIAEYSATGNPIITTNYGEVTYYFKDGENALVANSYNSSRFAEKMNFIIEYPEEAKKIGQKGKELGVKEFSHIKYGQKLKDYLQSVVLRKD